MASCQITDIPSDTWRAFRFLCLEEGVSANKKLRQLIEARVEMAGGGIDGKKENSNDRN